MGGHTLQNFRDSVRKKIKAYFRQQYSIWNVLLLSKWKNVNN